MILVVISFLFVLTLRVDAETSASSQVTGVKSKRGLYNFEDALIGPPPPPPFQTIPYGQPTPRSAYAPGPGKWTNVFGFDDITYQGIFNDLNGINYGIPTHITPPPNAVPSIYNNGFGYVNYAPHDYQTSYISHDGRVVKQYSVHERHHNDHPDPRSFQPSVSTPTQTLPAQFPPYYLPNNINIAQPRTLITDNRNTNANQIPSFLTKNHGPIALGSGSLGFIRLPNGDVYLGSGSLGYISHKDHYDNVIEISSRRQKAHARGPTTFGHAHQL